MEPLRPGEGGQLNVTAPAAFCADATHAPAHGTAFDIVGKGRADAGALEHALRIATRLAAARLH